MAALEVHYIQHVPFEDLAFIGDWLADRGHSVSRTRQFAGDPLPLSERFDWLVVMGGPMSVNDGAHYPWIDAELRLVREAIEAGKTVLGVCLGAQFVAAALGSRVYAAQEREIGWFPVTISSELFDAFPPRLTVLHWHGETFDLPEGARLLAQSAACRNQLFFYGERVCGVQFHLEATEASLRALVENSTDHLKPGPYVMSAEEMLGQESVLRQNNVYMERILLSLEAKTYAAGAPAPRHR
jgi:GMP synthase (glutamine-hydrolysing)